VHNNISLLPSAIEFEAPSTKDLRLLEARQAHDDQKRELNKVSARGLNLWLDHIERESTSLNKSSSHTLKIIKDDVRQLSTRNDYMGDLKTLTTSQEMHINMQLDLD